MKDGCSNYKLSEIDIYFVLRSQDSLSYILGSVYKSTNHSFFPYTLNRANRVSRVNRFSPYASVK